MANFEMTCKTTIFDERFEVEVEGETYDETAATLKHALWQKTNAVAERKVKQHEMAEAHAADWEDAAKALEVSDEGS